MDLLVTIAVAVLSGFGGGAAAAWLNRPAAHAQVAKETAKIERRRKIIDDARDAWREVYPSENRNLEIEHALNSDPRFLALRPHTDELGPYSGQGFDYYDIPVIIDTLEARWD